MARYPMLNFQLRFPLATKECLETKYWLHLLHDTDYLTVAMFNSLHSDADELGKMLFTTLRSTNRIKAPNNQQPKDC